MKKRDFYFFVVPSLLMMFLFIAVPLAIVFNQSFYITQNVFEKVEVETCTPGFLKQICETKIETKPIRDPTYKASKFNKPKFQNDISLIVQLINVTKASVPIICPPTKPFAARAVSKTEPGPNITPLIVP